MQICFLFVFLKGGNHLLRKKKRLWFILKEFKLHFNVVNYCHMRGLCNIDLI